MLYPNNENASEFKSLVKLEAQTDGRLG